MYKPNKQLLLLALVSGGICSGESMILMKAEGRKLKANQKKNVQLAVGHLQGWNLI